MNRQEARILARDLSKESDNLNDSYQVIKNAEAAGYDVIRNQLVPEEWIREEWQNGQRIG